MHNSELTSQGRSDMFDAMLGGIVITVTRIVNVTAKHNQKRSRYNKPLGHCKLRSPDGSVWYGG